MKARPKSGTRSGIIWPTTDLQASHFLRIAESPISRFSSLVTYRNVLIIMCTVLALKWSSDVGVRVIHMCKKKFLQTPPLLGPTVFRVPQNFEPSHGICPLLRNFNITTEYCGIWEMTSDYDHWVTYSSVIHFSQLASRLMSFIAL